MNQQTVGVMEQAAGGGGGGGDGPSEPPSTATAASTTPPPPAPYPPLPSRQQRTLAGRTTTSTATPAAFRRRPLFGGAVTCSMPHAWRDVSSMWEVPDHQEVWRDCAAGGPCLIVEILALQDDVPDLDAARFFFDDLADANGAPEEVGRRVDASGTARVGTAPHSEEDGDGRSDDGGDGGRRRRRIGPSDLSMPLLTCRAAACSCVGAQRIAKGRDLDLAGNSRAEKQEVEWVRIELCAVRLRQVQTDLLVTLSTPICELDGGAPLDEVRRETKYSDLFREVLRSLKVEDWTFFA